MSLWRLVENQRNKRVLKTKFLLIIVLFGAVLDVVAFICARESDRPHFQVLVDCILPPSINQIQEWDQYFSHSPQAPPP